MLLALFGLVVVGFPAAQLFTKASMSNGEKTGSTYYRTLLAYWQ